MRLGQTSGVGETGGDLKFPGDGDQETPVGLSGVGGCLSLQRDSELGALTHSLLSLPRWKPKSSPACETMKEQTGLPGGLKVADGTWSQKCQARALVPPHV